MSNEDTIRALLASAQHVAGEDAEAEARIAARQAWVREIIARFRAAQDRVGEAWDRIFDELGDDLDEDELEAIPEPPEQALVRRGYERRRAAAPLIAGEPYRAGRPAPEATGPTSRIHSVSAAQASSEIRQPKRSARRA